MTWWESPIVQFCHAIQGFVIRDKCENEILWNVVDTYNVVLHQKNIVLSCSTLEHFTFPTENKRSWEVLESLWLVFNWSCIRSAVSRYTITDQVCRCHIESLVASFYVLGVSSSLLFFNCPPSLLYSECFQLGLAVSTGFRNYELCVTLFYEKCIFDFGEIKHWEKGVGNTYYLQQEILSLGKFCWSARAVAVTLDYLKTNSFYRSGF